MKVQNNFLILTYSSLPGTEFLCDLKGNIRVKVQKRNGKTFSNPLRSVLYAVGGNCIFLFQDLGSRITCWRDFEPALRWYQKYCGQSRFDVHLPE